MLRIRNTAVDGANGSTLWLLVETYTFRAFVGNDIIKLVRDGRLWRFTAHYRTIAEINFGQLGAPTPRPFNTTFIDGCVGALGFAGTTVDALVGDHDSHEQYRFIRLKFDVS
jgi:hypothetical protein